MKSRILLLLTGLLLSLYSYSQKNEYQYIALKFGAIHGFSPQPDFNQNKYLHAPGNQEMQLSPVASFAGYAPGFSGAFLYHFDFVTDNSGIFTGLEYNYSGIASKYDTRFGGYTLNETHRMHSVGVPLAFKYGPKIWDTQRYVYAGVQFNYTFLMNSVQKVSWNTTPSSAKVEGDEFNKTGFSVFLGVNYLIFNIQFDFYPTSVFNEEYLDPNQYKPYAGQVQKSFAIKTSINVPYGWLSSYSFWWRRKLRKLPWK